MKIEVTYFKKSGKYYMEEEFEVPQRFIDGLVQNQRSLVKTSAVMFEFRNWFEKEVQHDEFIAVVLTDFHNFPNQSELLGFPMMVMPSKQKQEPTSAGTEVSH